uniref:Uncharacterized protein n=1 Tax=Goniomonas avonlea TaxID=1255295 RepID=A0A348G6M3_9CRYP|nr:hypothetical protein [Goniomonas avonlea]
MFIMNNSNIQGIRFFRRTLFFFRAAIQKNSQFVFLGPTNYAVKAALLCGGGYVSTNTYHDFSTADLHATVFICGGYLTTVQISVLEFAKKNGVPIITLVDDSTVAASLAYPILCSNLSRAIVGFFFFYLVLLYYIVVLMH